MSTADRGPTLVLASASATRARLLREAAVPFTVEPSVVDEGEVRKALKAAGASVADAATALAELKALRVAQGRDDARLVLGCDQILECDGEWFEKPADLAAARAQLLRLRGHRHRLVTAGVLIRSGRRVWHRVETAELWMRSFSTSFLDAYLDWVGAQALTSVGAYRIEGPGLQLFSRIEGDFFTILGLPLLSLLQALRDQGVLAR